MVAVEGKTSLSLSAIVARSSREFMSLAEARTIRMLVGSRCMKSSFADVSSVISRPLVDISRPGHQYGLLADMRRFEIDLMIIERQ